MLSVATVESVADGTVWVLQRASDGARTSVKFGTAVAGGLSGAIDSAVVVTALSTGYVLSVAGQAVAFLPNRSDGRCCTASG